LALIVRIKPGAAREIHRAAEWWSKNRPAAPGAIESDLKDALNTLVEQPGIGSKVENRRDLEVRRLYLVRTRYFVYYRPRPPFLEVIAFWHSSREHEPSL
jgi:plasmid stabilization system protein ParE